MLFRRRQRELEEELRSHLEMSCRDRCERGEDEQTARLNARRELGNVGLVAEVTRDMWTWTSLERLLQDLRYGWRVLWRSPGYTFVALFSLALGIGVNTAIFSLINAVMLKTLPVRDPAPLAIVGNPAAIGSLSQGSGMRTDFFSYPFYKEFRRRNQVFVDVYATGRSEYLNVATEEHGKTIAQTVHPSARLVTGNYFSILGVVPTLGRAFTDEETQVPGSAPVVVISYGYWEQQFGRDPNIIGRKLILNGAPFTVIGIAPRAFTGDIVGTPIDIWLPVTMKAQANPVTITSTIQRLTGCSSWAG